MAVFMLLAVEGEGCVQKETHVEVNSACSVPCVAWLEGTWVFALFLFAILCIRVLHTSECDISKESLQITLERIQPE